MFKKLFLAMAVTLFAVTGAHAASDVYVMRGLMGFLFPRAMYPIAEEAERRGYDTTMTCWQFYCRDMIIRRIESRPENKVVLIGHSMGGNAVTIITRQLAEKKIKVDYAVVVDAPVPLPVGSTTKVVDNFYQFNDFRNPKLTTESKKTKLTQYNYTGREDGVGILKGNKNHFTIAEDPFMIRRIFQQIEKLD